MLIMLLKSFHLELSKDIYVYQPNTTTCLITQWGGRGGGVQGSTGVLNQDLVE